MSIKITSLVSLNTTTDTTKFLVVDGAVTRLAPISLFKRDLAGFTGSAGAGFTGSVGGGYTGSPGFVGSQGPAGGYTGSQGTTGFNGSQGINGFTGSTGYVGSAGAGYTGSASTAPGYTGSVGFAGSTGYTGSASTVPGYTGSSSTAPGYTGSASTVPGYTGSVGFAGSAGGGFTGSAGTVGYTGSAGGGGGGFTGSAGAAGNDGATGFTGSAGATNIPYVDVRNYGYVADGVTNNATAINNAISALPATGGAIYFPPGIGIINSTITVNYPSGSYAVSFIGGGSDVTILQFNGCNGFIINAHEANQYIHFSDMNVTTNASTGNTYTGIAINNSVQGGYSGQNDITRVTLKGSIPYTNYWGCGINVKGMGNVNFDGVNVYGNTAGDGGVGIAVSGDPAGSFQYGIVYNIDKCGLYNVGIGILYGDYVQGVTVSQTNIVNGITGIYLAAESVGATQMSCTLCNFNTQANQIFLGAPVATVNLSSNSFYVPVNSNGVYLAGGDGFTINGNSFYGTGAGVGTGVNIVGSSTGVITGNYFGSLDAGVNLAGTASGMNVQANTYNSVITPVGNIGGNSVGVATH